MRVCLSAPLSLQLRLPVSLCILTGNMGSRPRDNLQALPASQRFLMMLVLRKLLASSTFAIAGALESLSRRLQTRLQQATEPQSLEEELTEDFEALALQRHFSVSTKFGHVESWCCGRQ
jgi:hypothetical protein